MTLPLKPLAFPVETVCSVSCRELSCTQRQKGCGERHRFKQEIVYKSTDLPCSQGWVETEPGTHQPILWEITEFHIFVRSSAVIW